MNRNYVVRMYGKIPYRVYESDGATIPGGIPNKGCVIPHDDTMQMSDRGEEHDTQEQA